MTATITDHKIAIDHLSEVSPQEQQALCALLTDCVAGGASIGFLPPLSAEAAQAYWQGVAVNVESGSTLLLVARLDGEIVGSLQLALAGKANARHRAEVEKLMVSPAARRQGIAMALMSALDPLAAQHGRTLLVLDTREGDVSEQVYQRCGYSRVGVIPQFARSADGSLDGTVLYYRLQD